MKVSYLTQASKNQAMSSKDGSCSSENTAESFPQQIEAVTAAVVLNKDTKCLSQSKILVSFLINVQIQFRITLPCDKKWEEMGSF